MRPEFEISEPLNLFPPAKLARKHILLAGGIWMMSSGGNEPAPGAAPVGVGHVVVPARLHDPGHLVEDGLGIGDASATAFGCDLTEQYVIENSEYTT